MFEIRQGAPQLHPQAATVNGEYISNDFYRLRLRKSGVITELFDNRAKGRQLVKAIDGKYLNDLGTTDLDEGNPLVIENAGPISVTFKAVSRNPILHTVRVTIYKDSPRIEIQDSIQTNFKDLKTWAFSFDLTNQTTRHEELGAVITAKTETRGGHYAAQNARYDWLTFNHFADMSEANYGVTISNQDCSFFKLGKSTASADRPDSLWEQSSQLNALAGGQTDGEKLGIFAQNGDSAFLYQFALQTHPSAFDAAAAMKFSLEHQNPLVAGVITGENMGETANTFSLLSVNDPNVFLWSVKPSEEGLENGLITRFWNMNAKPVTPIINLARPINSAWQTTHIETNEQKIAPVNGRLNASFRQHQLKTYRLILK